MERIIELHQLDTFIKKFTHNNLSRPTRLEVFNELGVQTEEHGLPLLGIDVEMRGENAPRIQIMLGGQSRSEHHLTHTIAKVSRVYLKMGDDHRDEVLEIESNDGSKTLLRFLSLQEISAA